MTAARKASTVYLHIGLPKTGTTTLQEILWHQRERAARAGVLYPGNDQRSQYRAAVDVHPGRYGEWDEPGVPGAWSWLVEQVRAWRGVSVISSELLAPASPDEAERVMASLRFAEVHLVCTTRDLARQIPSVWQENVKTGKTMPFPEFLAELRGGELTEASRLFWDYQDVTRVLQTWSAGLPADRVHVITVPPRGTSTRVLWTRFAALLGLDPDEFSTDVPQHNFSLGAAEAEVLRRVNVALPTSFDWSRYTTLVNEQLASDILSHPRGPSQIPLPSADYKWIEDTARRIIADIESAGYHVIGDLTDLLPPPPDSAAEISEPTDADMLPVAVRALAETIARIRTPPPSTLPVHRLRRAVQQLSASHSSMRLARRAFWRVRSITTRKRPSGETVNGKDDSFARAASGPARARPRSATP